MYVHNQKKEINPCAHSIGARIIHLKITNKSNVFLGGHFFIENCAILFFAHLTSYLWSNKFCK